MYKEITSLLAYHPPSPSARVVEGRVYEGEQCIGSLVDPMTWHRLTHLSCNEIEDLTLPSLLAYARRHLIRTFSVYPSLERQSLHLLAGTLPENEGFGLIHLSSCDLRDLKETILRREKGQGPFISLETLRERSEMICTHFSQEEDFLFSYFCSISQGFTLNGQTRAWGKRKALPTFSTYPFLPVVWEEETGEIEDWVSYLPASLHAYIGKSEPIFR